MKLRFDRILYQQDKRLGRRILLSPLSLLSIPYGWAVRLRVLAYDLGLRPRKTLPCPVISVGNITVGGTGKTPLVIHLAAKLKEKGIGVAVLSRGYKRRERSGSLVSDGQSLLLSPEASGDEPYLVATRLKGVPVLVGVNRFDTGWSALQQCRVDGLLLDDGYQHLRLHRDLDILLIDATVGFGDGHLLPRGMLREPLAQLRRAHLILLTRVDDPASCRPLEAKILRIHPSAQIFHSHDEPAGWVGPAGEWEDAAALRGKSVLAVSGIARPEHFASLLNKCGVRIEAEVPFPDHHPYSAEDVSRLEKMCQGVDWMVTTEKDLLKLKKLRIDSLRMRALRMEIRIWEEEVFVERVLKLFFPSRDA